MGNSSNSNVSDRNQSLLQTNVNNIQDPDISLLVNEQPQIKKIFAIKNPVLLKRNSLTLDRDSNSRNIYYIQFTYDAVVNMNINIYFNAVRNKDLVEKKLNSQKNKKKETSKNDKNDTSTTLLIRENNGNLNSHLNYIPGKNFENNVLKFYNVSRGQNVKFFNPLAFIDMSSYNSNKEEKEDSFDIVIEFVPIFKDEEIVFEKNKKLSTKESQENKENLNSNIVKETNSLNNNTSNSNTNSNENEILFYTLCKVYTNEENNQSNNLNLINSILNNNKENVESNSNSNSLTNSSTVNLPLYKIRIEAQRLKSQSMWFDMYEVFNSALESGECLICCNHTRNTLFLPCKHSCSCQNCAHSLRMRNNPCPICKNSIDDLVIIDTDDK